MSKAGRPRIEIDWVQFDNLCGIQCTLREIADYFNCSVDTIERACKRDRKADFAEYFEQKRGRGKISLRRKQFELALQGDRTMLIWLGKQYLNQGEREEDIIQEEVRRIITDEAEEKLTTTDLIQMILERRQAYAVPQIEKTNRVSVLEPLPDSSPEVYERQIDDPESECGPEPESFIGRQSVPES